MSNPSNHLNIEQGKIITISVLHLHPDTIAALEAHRGDLPEGPSVAVRDEGYLVNSHYGTDDVLKQDLQAGLHPSLNDRHPDLVMIRALARGLGAEWVNVDIDGVECCDILPIYRDRAIELPTGEGWRDALSEIETNSNGNAAVVASPEVLEIIEAGQTPMLDQAMEP